MHLGVINMININNVIALSLDGEQWKQIPNCPNYLVSNMGRVYSGNKNRIKDGSYTESGYHVVELRSKFLPNGRKNFRVSRLVAAAFCKGYSEGKEVHHCNLCRFDDRADNLICVTPEQHRAIHEALDCFLNDLLDAVACYKAISNEDESEVSAA